MKCTQCNQSFNRDELTGYNINNEMVSISEYDLERNLQNPDYLVRVVCGECEEN